MNTVFERTKMMLLVTLTMNVIRAWKYVGETPLHALQRVREQYGIPEEVKACYTGRLDPMAQGVITLLFGPAVHLSHSMNTAWKVYRFQAILGVSTTSYDPLGRHTEFKRVTAGEAELFMQEMLKIQGSIEQVLPPYSAYKYKGMPLWRHANEGTLPAELPTKTVTVHKITALQDHPVKLTLSSYMAECKGDIREVQRRNEPGTYDCKTPLEDWNDLGKQGCVDHVWRIVFSAKVGTGTFIRSLVHDLGKRLNIPAHAFRITRTELANPVSKIEEAGLGVVC